MIPSTFVLLESLPLTPSGKVDRQGLPEPDTMRPELKTDFVGARDLLEYQMGKIWMQVLGSDIIGVRDNFFEVGGTSLLALRLFLEIEAVFKIKLPLITLIEASTIEKLTAILRNEGLSANWSSLVPIQEAGRKLPFFGIHGGLAHVLFYYPLARLLGPDQPFYALQPQGLDGASLPQRRVEEMAARYVKEIRRIQAKGPYCLGGRSFGGVVAFEMARQLHQLGQEVAFVGLFDTYFPSSRARRVREGIRYHGRQFIYSKDKLGYLQRVRRRRMQRQVGSDMPPEVQALWRACGEAGRKYRPRFYAGRVTLFTAKEPDRLRSLGQSEAWRRCAGGGLDIREIPGTHGSMFDESHLSVLAEELQECLDRVQSHQTDKADLVEAS